MEYQVGVLISQVEQLTQTCFQLSQQYDYQKQQMDYLVGTIMNNNSNNAATHPNNVPNIIVSPPIQQPQPSMPIHPSQKNSNNENTNKPNNNDITLSTTQGTSPFGSATESTQSTGKQKNKGGDISGHQSTNPANPWQSNRPAVTQPPSTQKQQQQPNQQKQVINNQFPSIAYSILYLERDRRGG